MKQKISSTKKEQTDRTGADMIVYYISKLPNKRTVHNWKNELYMPLEHEINDFLIFHSTQVVKSRERKKVDF